ncbi:UDP-N-acetylmuramate dehydrogenase [Luteimonas cucumeris]|uniref:UDP-N-acetylenolpyruvoylglucosamine reductase n=1 Tax=Luteimonas cucumeris TaxID=985012 RepID=A0A562L7N4_9GAMM|nr:UDP-N-acetylmuramate dehydrogenase [Luteimonas cucumeris]TWI03536.1 UDP-N-acetylmuramate dehydrogenase [Luteimonas cucumeris]
MSTAYRITRDASLRARNTFGVDARAGKLIEVDDADALAEILASESDEACPLVLGGGSNLLFAGNPDGPVLALGSRAFRVIADDGDHVVIRADAGVQWHAFVMATLEQGYRGLENLALIPGTVGAAPIQNIGAYGVEVETLIHAVEAFEHDGRRHVRLDREACDFAYRDSRFKREPDRHIVTAVEFVLSRSGMPQLEYAGIRDELAAMHIDNEPDALQVAEAVIRLRRRKLPDPAVIGNAGSFFKNPIVPLARAEALQAQYEALPMFRVDGAATRKLSAAWLIDACGWKGHRDGDAGVSERHALVLVNHGSASGMQLLDLARRIADSVRERFGVALEPEPRLIGAEW